MSGRSVVFHTGLCLIAGGRVHEAMVPTQVAFRDLADAEIERYLDREPAFDCAGQRQVGGPRHRPARQPARRRPDRARGPAAHRAGRHAAQRGPSGSVSEPAALYLVPVPLAEDARPEDALPAPVIARVRGIGDFVVENAKSARRFLSACGHPGPIASLRLSVLDEHTPEADVDALLAPLREGRDMACFRRPGPRRWPIPARCSSPPRTRRAFAWSRCPAPRRSCWP